MAGQPGRSGRKPTDLGRYRKEILATKDKMGAELVALTDKLLDRAHGLHVLMAREVNERSGEESLEPLDEASARRCAEDPAFLADLVARGAVRVYTRPPDMAAILVAYERIMGKVPQQVNVEVKQTIQRIIDDQETLVRILEEHVPDEALGPILESLRRIRGDHRAASGILAQ